MEATSRIEFTSSELRLLQNALEFYIESQDALASHELESSDDTLYKAHQKRHGQGQALLYKILINRSLD